MLGTSTLWGRVNEVGVSLMVGWGSIPLLGILKPRHTYPVPHDVAGGLVCQIGTVLHGHHLLVAVVGHSIGDCGWHHLISRCDCHM